MLGVYLDYLYSEFQIQRLLRRHTEAAIPALLDISMQLLTTALVLNKQRNQSYGHQRHFASIVSVESTSRILLNLTYSVDRFSSIVFQVQECWL